MEILYKTKRVVVVYKPPGVPSQKDPSGDADAMTLTEAKLRELGESSALWLVHRLDRVVGGLLIFARDKVAAAELSKLVQNEGIIKKYLLVAGADVQSGIMEDYIFKDKMTSKAYITDRIRAGVKKCKLECNVLARESSQGYNLASVRLYTGRYHQIRAQLSSRGASIVGDKKYGSRDAHTNMPALFAYELSFVLFGEKINVKRYPDFSVYPWNLFSLEDVSKQ